MDVAWTEVEEAVAGKMHSAFLNPETGLVRIGRQDWRRIALYRTIPDIDRLSHIPAPVASCACSAIAPTPPCPACNSVNRSKSITFWSGIRLQRLTALSKRGRGNHLQPPFPSALFPSAATYRDGHGHRRRGGLCAGLCVLSPGLAVRSPVRARLAAVDRPACAARHRTAELHNHDPEDRDAARVSPEPHLIPHPTPHASGSDHASLPTPESKGSF